MTRDRDSLSTAGNAGTTTSRWSLFGSFWAKTVRGAHDLPVRLRLSSRLTADVVLDVLERALVLGLFVYFAHRMLSPLTQLLLANIAHPSLLTLEPAANIGAVLLVASELLGAVLILLRPRSATLSHSPIDWGLNVIAACAPFLAIPAAASTLIPGEVSTALMLSGMFVQILAKATLWRSFGILPANRGIKITGPYRVVRHPMYAGYTLVHIGFLLGFPSLQNTILYAIAFAVQIARLLREEKMLNKDLCYREYASRVKYRLCPRIF